MGVSLFKNIFEKSFIVCNMPVDWVSWLVGTGVWSRIASGWVDTGIGISYARCVEQGSLGDVGICTLQPFKIIINY